MDTENECGKYRSSYDELAAGLLGREKADAMQTHADACGACRSWQTQTAALMKMTGDLPMFDVSEQLTQKILTSVEAESKMPTLTGHYGLLVPVATICVAGLVTIFPIDSMEGVFSTIVSAAGVYAVKLLISGAKTTDEVVA